MTSEPTRIISTVVTVLTVYPGPGGGAVFTARDSSGQLLKAKASYECMPLPPVKGQILELTGEFKSDRFYGPQLHVRAFQQIEPVGELLYRYLRQHPAFKGIGLGDSKIAKLYHTFGNGLRGILENGDTDSLSHVLTEALAERLLAAWRSNAQESSVIAFLSRHRLDVRLAHKILRYWGEGAVEKLRENPYRLLILTSWESADRLAKSVGIDLLDPRRLVAAAEAYSYSRLDIRKDTLTDVLNLRIGVKRLLGRVDEGAVAKAVELAVQDKAIVGNPDSGYQPVGCAIMETQIADRLKVMLHDSSHGQIDLFGSAGCNTLVDTQISLFEQGEGIRLNKEQRSAVHMAATSNLCVLKGGAGVGKTTVLKAIHRVVEAMHAKVFQMALAGRAAQRMREATGEDAYTIIGFLNRLKHGDISPRPGDLVVIDESSMLDLLLTYRLVKALRKGVRLLLVGDPSQLPPIGPGLIFHVLTHSPAVPSTELIQVHRQAASTGIPQAAQQVREGIVPDFSDYKGSGYGVSFVECQQRSIVTRVVDIINDLGGFRQVQILGTIKSGPSGVKNINATFHQIMSPGKPRLREWDLAEADPVVFTTNDYEREIFNGSLGHLERVFPDDPNGSQRAVVNFDGRTFDLSEDDLGNVELAYAITVHKAQGSQFKRVVIPLTKNRLLDRTLIYTALTRGVDQVIFLGSKRELSMAVQRPPVASARRVGFFI